MKIRQTSILSAGLWMVIAVGSLVLLERDREAWAMEKQTEMPAAQTPDPRANAPKGVIGVSLHVGAERIGDPAVLYIAHVHPEGPAQKAGLAHGDEVSSVDGQSVTGKTYEQVVMMIRGEVGTTVKLNVKGDNGAREVAIPRVADESLYKAGMGSHGNPSR